MSVCCNSANHSRASTRLRKIHEMTAWIFPSAVLMLVPKCPACVAAYVALWTGIGLSLTTAAYLRWELLLVCASMLVLLVANRLLRAAAIVTHFRHIHQENKPCHTK